MKPEEIRAIPIPLEDTNSGGQTYERQFHIISIVLLREIAAQLAEANELKKAERYA